jgi:hypothetical protein
MACPRSYSWFPWRSVAPSSSHYFIAALPDCFGVPAEFLRSAWHKVVDVHGGRIGCYE